MFISCFIILNEANANLFYILIIISLFSDKIFSLFKLFLMVIFLFDMEEMNLMVDWFQFTNYSHFFKTRIKTIKTKQQQKITKTFVIHLINS